MHAPVEDRNAGTPPRRVMWLIKGLGNGGAEQLLVSSARLRNRDEVTFRVVYLLPWKDALVGALAREGVFATCLGSRGSWDVRWLARLRGLLLSEPVDIVHAHSPVAAAGARLIVRTLPRSKRPVMMTTEHNVWSSHQRLTRCANASTARLDDITVAVSGAVRDSMPPLLRSRTRVVRYGVDVDAVLAAAMGARDSVRSELGLTSDDVVVGTVANFRSTKAYPDLLAAASIVVDEVPNVRFVAVGQGPLEADIRRLHAQLGLAERFLLTGYRADAVRVMSAFDVFCLASHHEGLPIAMLEALTLGLPVVATDVGGIKEFFGDGADAVLVPRARPDELAKAIMGIVSDSERRRVMAHAAAARRPELAVGRAVHEIETIYAEATAR
jgi:glycosyltransferase involved in cell wall biosynthesis